MTAVERRYTPGLVELRRTEERARIGGYGIVFNVLSRNLGGFVERSAPSVVNKSRADGWPDVVARFDHENAFLLGTIAGRTLELSIDEPRNAGFSGGLSYLVDPPRSRADIVELVERGDVHKSSFAFRVVPGGDDWGVTDQGYPMRTLLEVQLVDVAPVVSPAYTDTTAGLRSLAARFEAEEEEVRAMAAADELRRFFTKTEAGMPAGKPKPRLFGPAAAAALLVRKQDPWG
jgi:HK97 family phage prohead protease